MIVEQSCEACPIKRERRSKAEIATIKGAIYDAVKPQAPMTVRQAFYQLVVRGVIDKTEKEYRGTVIRLLTETRLTGELPFDWIVDESRITRTFSNVADALWDTVRCYRRSALRDGDDYIEIWCEKDALAGLLWDVTSHYDVPLMVSRGMPSLTFLHGTAVNILKAAKAGKDSYIYQFGDHDPSGVLIPQAIKTRLGEFCERFGCFPPFVERIALTEEQIKEFDLPTRPTKRDGNRHAKNFEGDSVELDALPPHELRSLVQEAIERHISQRALEITRAAEESERKILTALTLRHRVGAA
jgi:hypothetical protein